VIPPVVNSLASTSPAWAFVTARADAAVADHSRNLTTELAVMDPDANRDDVDVTGHRRTELRLDEAAA
jgi:hypothetical protein